MLFQFPGPGSLTQFLNSYLKTFAVFQNSDYLGCSFLPKRCFCGSKFWNVLFPCLPGHFWTRSAYLWTRKPTAVWPKWSLSFTCWQSSNAVSFSKLKACWCFFLIVIFWGPVKTQNCLLHRLSPCSGPLWSSPEGRSHVPPAASKRPRSHVRRRHRHPEASGWNTSIFDGSLNVKIGEKAEWLFFGMIIILSPTGLCTHHQRKPWMRFWVCDVHSLRSVSIADTGLCQISDFFSAETPQQGFLYIIFYNMHIDVSQ